MYIFNTTFLVSDKLYGAWFKWLYEHHIPTMLNSGCFDKPQVAKVMNSKSERGTSYCVQFRVANTELLETWNLKHADIFMADFDKRFGTDILFFSTTLELIE